MSALDTIRKDHYKSADLEAARSFFDPSPQSIPRRERFRAHYWHSYSWRLRRPVGVYRQIGLDHWVSVEANPAIGWYTERPCPIKLRVGRRDQTHRFDLVLQYYDRIECRRLFDVDSLSDLHGFEIDAVENEKRWCRQFGYQYRMISHQELAAERVFIENWKSLLPWVREPNARLDQRILAHVAATGELTVAELEVLLADVDRTEIKSAIVGLLHRGQLRSGDLRQLPYSPAITVGVPHG